MLSLILNYLQWRKKSFSYLKFQIADYHKVWPFLSRPDVDVNLGSNESTPLIQLTHVAMGSPDAEELLIAMLQRPGVDVDQQAKKDGRTGLIEAVLRGSMRLCKLFIFMGCAK